MYRLLRPLLFRMNAETAHHATLGLLDIAYRTGCLKTPPATAQDGGKMMGITLANRVGLAAGLDKNAEHIDALFALGFGFVEVGTVTPRPQNGNPKPRLFRIPQHHAVLNRMGFNNHGVAAMLEKIAGARRLGVLGVNIGKNADTPVDNAVADYLSCLDAVYAVADYVTVNISSPNTKNLRTLQEDGLGRLLGELKNRQEQLAAQHGRYVPLAVKIAPDLTEEGVTHIARTTLDCGIDGIIATNTTIDKSAVSGSLPENDAGGISGAPVKKAANHVLAQLSRDIGDNIDLIGVGGIMCGADAVEKIRLGAKAVQLYSGLVYRGPALIRECILALRQAS